MKDTNKEMAMRDLTILVSAFFFLLIVVPMLMILTLTVNSALPTFSILLFGTPVLTLIGAAIAYWFIKHDDIWLKKQMEKAGNMQ